MRDTIAGIVNELLELNTEATILELKYDKDLKEYQEKITEYIGIISKKNAKIKELESFIASPKSNDGSKS